VASEWLTPAVVALLASAVGTMFTILVRARIDMRKAKTEQDRAPIELENIFLGGAEVAVAALKAALDRAEAHIAKLEHDLAERDRKIGDLEDDLTKTLARLARLQERCEQLGVRIAELRTDERPT
jgi:chromosome segregation ATPase